MGRNIHEAALVKHKRKICQLDFKSEKLKSKAQKIIMEMKPKINFEKVTNANIDECKELLFGSSDTSLVACISNPKFISTAKYAVMLEAKTYRPKLSTPI